ncbi:ovostatin-like, partial [Rhinophrynus dorsalis]
YVFGQPVPGKVLVTLCRGANNAYGTQRNCYNKKKNICTEITGELDSNGNFYCSIDLLPFHLELMPYPLSFTTEVTVIEDGTGFQFTRYCYVGITSQLATIYFDYGFMLYHYKAGIPYTARVYLVDEKNLPLANEEIYLDIDGMSFQKILTDSNGKADYLIDTTNFAQPNFTIRASYPNPEQCYKPDWYDPGYGFPSADFTVYRFYSESGSFVQVQSHLEALICGKSTNIEVQYILTKEGVGEGASTVTFCYMLMAQSKIVHNGKTEVTLTEHMNGSFSFEIEASYNLGPHASIIVFCVLKTDLIMDTVDLDIEPCLQNEVAMNFSKEEGLPGAPVDITISASPNSLCALKVIDKRLLLLNSYDSFTLSAVFYSQLFWTISGYYVNGLNFEDPAPICTDTNKQIFCKGGYYIPVSSPTDGDTYQKYQSLGLVCVTNNNLRRPVVCGMENDFPPIIPFLNGKTESTSFLADSGAAPIVTVRRDFSETFSWVKAHVNSTGHVTLTRDDVPDSVTEWEGSTFCLSNDTGLGMTTKPAVYRTFLHFFLDFTPPYTMRRGEILQLRTYTSNYLEKYIKVIATLQNSTDFEAESKDEEMEKCAPPGGRVNYTWHFNFLKLGDQIPISITAQTTNIGDACDGPNDPSQPPRMDTVIKTLHVKPEGIKKELSSSNLVYVEDSSTEITITITVPENMVPDSLYAYVIALGDPFGLPLKNLRNLLPIPQGTCLPNVALLESALCVLDYMNSTDQLSEEDKLMAISSIQTSYYLLLRFRFWNGGFTNFYGWAAELDVSLSVEVFCVLVKARRVIYVDPNVIEQLVINMVNMQDVQSGCMKQVNVCVRQFH